MVVVHKNIRTGRPIVVVKDGVCGSGAQGDVESEVMSFDDYRGMIAGVMNAKRGVLREGDTIMVRATGVPDVWVSGVWRDGAEYRYTSDDVMERELRSEAGLRAGYVTLMAVEGGDDECDGADIDMIINS